MKKLLSIAAVGFGFALGAATGPALAEKLPDDISNQFNSLVDSSPDDPAQGLYQLAADNPRFADEIACLLVKQYDDDPAYKAAFFELINDNEVRGAIDIAFKNCELPDLADRGEDLFDEDPLDKDNLTDPEENPSRDLLQTSGTPPTTPVQP